MFFFACLLAAVEANAQQTSPVLISQADSTRAIAFDSVTHRREPFTTTAQIAFGADSATRIMLFAMNLQLQPGEAPHQTGQAQPLPQLTTPANFRWP